jgi:hypothetical protein
MFDDESNEVVEGVIVIPDISGYTAFVSGVALVHAQGIVTRLMRAIVGNGWERMTVSKLLGDAVLMYVSRRGRRDEPRGDSGARPFAHPRHLCRVPAGTR